MLPIDNLYRTARSNPDAIAVESAETRLTYRELVGRVDAVATAIQALLPGKQNRVAVCGYNTVEHFISILAIYASANTWVALNPRNAKLELDRMVELAKPSLFIVDENCLGSFGQSGSPIWLGHSQQSAQGDSDALHKIFASKVGMRPEWRGPVLDDVQVIKFTGGSTGIPKAVQQTYRNGNVVQAHLRMVFGINSRDAYLAVSPLTHGGGVYIIPMLAVGGRQILMDKPSAAGILDAVEQRRVTRVFLPPTLIYQMMAEQAARPRDLSALYSITYGAAPMPVEKIQEAQAIFGNKIDVIYGQTEAPQCLAAATREELADERNRGTVGRPCPLVRVEVMDSAGRILPPNEPGEIVARGDLIMKGYLDNPALTAKTIVDGWLHTGDVGIFDERGYLTIKDRLKDMVISGGFNVYPADVESVLACHSAVYESVVFGVPDDKWGERVEAAVQLRNEAKVQPDELIAFLKQRIGSVQTPKAIHIVEALPRNAVGKVLRRDVRELFKRTEGGR